MITDQCLRFVFLLVTRVAAGLRLSRRGEMWKTAEILILRHQLSVLQRRQPRRPKLDWADRALLATLLGVIPKERRQGLRLLITPDTVVRWHRDIVRRRQAARSACGRTGRPATRRNIRALVRRLARENPQWGIAGFTAKWPDSASRSQRPPCGRSSRPAASIPAGGRPGRPGRNSCAPRPRPSWRGFLHRRPARRHPGLRPGRDRACEPAYPHPRDHPASHRGVHNPASPQPTHGSRRPGRPGQVLDPRPRLELHRRVRRRSSRRWHPDRALQHPDAPHERAA